jgi:hypothetical protein
VSERDNVLPITPTGRVRAARPRQRQDEMQELEPIEPNIRDYLRVIFD